MNRRDFFRRILDPLQASARSLHEPASSTNPAPSPAPTPPRAKVASIMARYCLPYQEIPCTACSERCPVPGAIVIEEGLPRVVSNICTGCEACVDACPPPTRAILLK